MSWTYTAANMATSPKDYVRFLIGDTISTDPQLTDEAINSILTLTSSLPYPAALQCCLALQALYARRADIAIDSFRVAMSDRVKAYKDLYNQIRIQNATRPGALGAPVVSGISISDMQSNAGNTDRVPSRESVGMMEAPGIIPPTAYYAVWPFFITGTNP